MCILLYSIQSKRINTALLGKEFDSILDLVDEELLIHGTDDPLTLKQQYLYLVRGTFLMLMGDIPKCRAALGKLIAGTDINTRVSVLTPGLVYFSPMLVYYSPRLMYYSPRLV